jgi:hypothetical protein
VKRGTVVPCFLDDGHWSACFGLSYLELMLHDTLGSQRVVREGGTYLRKVAGTGGIADGRNEVARQFLDHTDGEWLWMVDTDMGFAADTVDRLLTSADPHRRPVVGGLCFAQRRTGPGEFHAERFGIIPTVYQYVETGDEVGFAPIAAYERDTVTRCAGTGMACVLIHRRVLFKIREAHGDVWFDPMKHPTGMHGKPRTFSEDLSFCVRLAALDLPLHVDTAVKTCHEKGGLFLDEDAYDRQQAFEQMTRESEPLASTPRSRPGRGAPPSCAPDLTFAGRLSD